MDENLEVIPVDAPAEELEAAPIETEQAPAPRAVSAADVEAYFQENPDVLRGAVEYYSQQMAQPAPVVEDEPDYSSMTWEEASAQIAAKAKAEALQEFRGQYGNVLDNTVIADAAQSILREHNIDPGAEPYLKKAIKDGMPASHAGNINPAVRKILANAAQMEYIQARGPQASPIGNAPANGYQLVGDATQAQADVYAKTLGMDPKSKEFAKILIDEGYAKRR